MRLIIMVAIVLAVAGLGAIALRPRIARAAMLQVGAPAPDFHSQVVSGDQLAPVSLADFHGRKLVLYFYPKDNTPGCTKEACAFRDGYARFQAAGISVLGFPEGTTTRGDDVLPFRRGLFGLAQLAGVPIVPIAVHYLSPELPWYGDAWFLPHYLRTAMRPSSLARVRVGAAIAPATFHEAEELAQRARSTVRSMLCRVRA